MLVAPWPTSVHRAASKIDTFYRRLLEEASGIPGVTASALTRNGNAVDASFFTVAVAPERRDAGLAMDVNYDMIETGYFHALGVTFPSGREFSERDRSGEPKVAIVNAALAAKCCPGADVIGRRLAIEHDLVEIVGIAADHPWRNGHQPFLYLPLFQDPPWWSRPATLVLRTAGRPGRWVAALRRRVAGLDANVPLIQPRTMREGIEGALADERLMATGAS